MPGKPRSCWKNWAIASGPRGRIYEAELYDLLKAYAHRRSLQARSNRAGPFRTLNNSWQFLPLSDGSCLVDFFIEAEFKIGMLQMLLEANKARAGQVLINRFSAEAARRYAISGDPSVNLDDEIDALLK